MIALSIHLSLFTSYSVEFFLNWKFFSGLVCLYILGHRIFIQYLILSRPKQLILALIIVSLNYFSLTYMNNNILLKLFNAVGSEYSPSVELINSLSLVQLTIINLLIISFTGLAISIKDFSYSLTTPVSQNLSPFAMAFISSFLVIVSLNIYIFDKKIYSGKSQIIQKFDFREQEVCESKLKKLIYKTKDKKHFYYYKPIVIDNKKTNFQFYSCENVNEFLNSSFYKLLNRFSGT